MRNVLLISFFAISAAACSDYGTTGNKATPKNLDDAVFVASASIIDTVDHPTLLAFGNGISDSLNVFDGQSQISPYNRTATVVVGQGDKITVLAAPNGQYGIVQDGTKPAKFEFLSDWAPVLAGKHPGVRVEAQSEVDLLVSSYYPETGEEASPKMMYKSFVSSGNLAISKVLPNAPGVVRYVEARQKYTVSCVGNDSLTFHSAGGLITANTDTYGARVVYGPLPLADVTVRCTPYASKALAMKAALNRAQ